MQDDAVVIASDEGRIGRIVPRGRIARDAGGGLSRVYRRSADDGSGQGPAAALATARIEEVDPAAIDRILI
jgi:hypothetical protein